MADLKELREIEENVGNRGALSKQYFEVRIGVSPADLAFFVERGQMAGYPAKTGKTPQTIIRRKKGYAMRVTCPECAQALSLKAELPPGKRIKCPKCATVFAPIPVEAEEPLEEISEKPLRKKPAPTRTREDDDDDDDRDDYEERPRKRKSKAKKGGSSLLLYSVLGGVGVLVAIGIFVTLFFVIAGRGNARERHEAVAQDAVSALVDLENVFRTVKNKDTARDAAVKINQICDRLEEIGKKAKTLPRISVADDQQLQAKFKPQIDAINQRMGQVGFQAGMNSGGEPSFMAAAMRLERVGKELERFGK